MRDIDNRPKPQSNIGIWLLIFAMSLSLINLTPAQAQTPVAAPVFSSPRGFYDAPVALSLSTPTAGATIRYTLDGSTPSPTAGTVYDGPITITTTTAVRAIAYLNATSRSAVATHTYIFLAGVRTQSDAPPPGWPSFFAASDSNGIYPADYGVDPEVVNHPNNSAIFEQVMKALPSVSIVTDLPRLWDPTTGIYYNPNAKEPYTVDPLGQKWERPISIEWIDPNGGPGFAENGGMRIHGQASRRPHRQPKKNLRIYFKASYGTPRLNFALFNHDNPVSVFDRILLRNGGNRVWSYFDRDQRRETDYVNDEWARRAWLKMGHLAPHGTYAHVYLNGLYWGLYNVTERIDEKFLKSYLGGVDADYELIEAEEELGDIPVADPGTLDAYNAVLALVDGTSPLSDAAYAQLKTKVDLVSLADYFVHVHYIAKSDWPHHNYTVYRKINGPDTRFKFITWDNDSGLNKVTDNNTLAQDTKGPDDAPSRIFFRAVTHPEFRQLLADRLFKHVVAPNGVLAPAQCAALYTELTAIVDQAVIGESARWGDYARDVYPPGNNAPKNFPAYLHSRDLPTAYTDPGNQVSDSEQKTWLTVRNEKLSNYCPNRSNTLVNQYVSNGWYQTGVRPPTLSKYGGAVVTNYALALTNPNSGGAGEILYTINGVDPRLEGGASAPDALNGGDAVNITISEVTTVKARIRNGATWSPLADYTFTPSGNNAPPTVSISNPTNGAVFNAGASVSIQATAADADGSVAQVVFQANGNTLCTDTSAPFACTWTPATPGEATLTAIATDDAGAATTSSPVNITINPAPNTPPAVSITSPSNGAAFNTGASVNIQATATDADGTVTQVVFQANGSTLCTDTSAPFTCAWVPGAPGAVALTAIATDNAGAATTSSPVNVTVNTGSGGGNAFIEQGGTVVMEAENFDSNVARGNHAWQPQLTPAGFSGASAMIALPNINTNLQTNIPSSSPEMIYNINLATTGVYNVWLRALGPTGSDDSVHVGSDGALRFSPSLAGTSWFWKKVGTLSFSSAGAHSVHLWMREDGTLIDKIMLTTGSATPTGVGPTESPRGGGGNNPPSVSISSPANGATVNVGASVTIQATAADADGSVTQVVFQANGSTLCTDTSAPFSCDWTPGAPGNVALTAIATDNGGASTTSAPVNITVNSNGGGNGAFIEQGGTVVMEAENYSSKTARSQRDWLPNAAIAGYSGAGAMTALPNGGLNIQTNIQSSSPEMAYQVLFSTPGVYNIWLRAAGPTGSDDSLHVGLNGAVRASPAVSGAAWFWKKVGTLTISSPGLNSVNIWMREDGTSLDKLLLTTGATTPSGAGPAESPRNGAALQIARSNALPASDAYLAAGQMPEAELILDGDAGAPLALRVAFPIDEDADDDAVWEAVYLADDMPITGCEALGLSAVCKWSPPPGGHLVQVIVYRDGREAASTTLLFPARPASAMRSYLPMTAR